MLLENESDEIYFFLHKLSKHLINYVVWFEKINSKTWF